MVLIALVLCVLWLAAIVVVVGLCASAARGDEQLRARSAPGSARARMRLIA